MNQSTHDSDKNGPGMIIALIVILVLMVGCLGYIGIKSYLSNLAEKYTDVDPIVLPEVAASEPEVDEVLQRFDDFMREVEANTAPVELSLSANDINILINHHPEWSDLEGGMYVSIEGQEIHARMSLEITGSASIINGRYINGNGVFRVGVLDGQPELYLDSLEMSGEQVTGFIMDKIRSANLLGDNEWDPESEEVFQRVKSFQIVDERIVMEVVPQGDEQMPSIPATTSSEDAKP